MTASETIADLKKSIQKLEEISDDLIIENQRLREELAKLKKWIRNEEEKEEELLNKIGQIVQKKYLVE